MKKMYAGPATVRNDEPDRQNRIGGSALEPAVRAAVGAVGRAVDLARWDREHGGA